ncbi:MAG TPA: tetratricopeptide repeat protein [bacterium]|jgi:hypothetical protein|nr:tetratricopeptide repeat protein [bacterium]
MSKRFLAVVALLAVAGPVFADKDVAYADYREGIVQERTRDYPGAVASFKAALNEEPSLIYAEKQLGNCFYYLGDDRAALKHYDLYLAIDPSDAATEKFAEYLRARSAGRAPQNADGRGSGYSLDSPGLIHSRFYVGGSLGLLDISDSDLNNLIGSSYTVESDAAFFGDLHVGYQWQNGIALEIGEEALARVAVIQDSFGDDLTFEGTEDALCVEPLYRFTLSRRTAVLTGLKLGIGSASAVFTGDSGSTTLASVGSTLVEPDLRFQFMLGRMVGLEAGLDYRFAAYNFDLDSGGGSGGTWRMVDDGLVESIGVDVYFGHIVN